MLANADLPHRMATRSFVEGVGWLAQIALFVMLGLLADHNSKEEPVIYPHVDADLDAGAQATLADFLETGTMPEGWVCERA